MIIIKKSKRKTIQIEIDKNLDVIIRAPLNMSNSKIRKFIENNQNWINIHMDIMTKKVNEEKNVKKISDTELNELKKMAKIVIPEGVKYYSKKIGVEYGKVTIRCQKTRWGSCTSEGNLNFNVALMKAPKEVLDYVIVHELCHRKQMNHSEKFWIEVGKIIPNYKIYRKWLKDNGNKLLLEVVGK